MHSIETLKKRKKNKRGACDSSKKKKTREEENVRKRKIRKKELTQSIPINETYRGHKTENSLKDSSITRVQQKIFEAKRLLFSFYHLR